MVGMVARRVDGGERLVDTEAINVAAQQGAGAVILGDPLALALVADRLAADREIARGRAVVDLRSARFCGS
jgi:hypothetical protein